MRTTRRFRRQPLAGWWSTLTWSVNPLRGKLFDTHKEVPLTGFLPRFPQSLVGLPAIERQVSTHRSGCPFFARPRCCLLYTSDAADDLLCVDLGGRRIIKK